MLLDSKNHSHIPPSIFLELGRSGTKSPDAMGRLYPSINLVDATLARRGKEVMALTPGPRCTLRADPLVLHLQLVHDGDLPGGSGEHDPDAHPAQGLRPLQQGRGDG